MGNEARNRRVRQDQQSPSRSSATRDTPETCCEAYELLGRSCHVQRFTAHCVSPPEGTCHRRDPGQGKTGSILLLPGKGRCLVRIRYRVAATLRLGNRRSCSKAEVTACIDVHQYVYMFTRHIPGYVRIFRASRVIKSNSRAGVSQELPFLHPQEEGPN